jgi:hypothetical protein
MTCEAAAVPSAIARVPALTKETDSEALGGLPMIGT